MNERKHYIKTGKKSKYKGNHKLVKENKWNSYWTMPGDKISKRAANKKVRKSNCVDGNYYKKVYDSFEWS